jgi:asparagine synthase (glutamine-hydrolysing)
MCGICGIANRDFGRPVEVERLTTMRRSLVHRGPDGHGIHIEAGVGLAHQRLSIIDLEGGSQPLANEDETIWVSFNGEIYNYRALTEELKRRGHRFRTRSDTEVLVHGYEEYGLGLLEHLNGMFAFALHDVPHRRLVLARDQLGIKPLFYAVDRQALVFGSEIKAVQAALERSPCLRHASLQEYLLFRYVAWSRTLFEEIRRLPAGHLAVWEDGELEVRRYWEFPAYGADRDLSGDETVTQLDSKLSEAVAAQLMSDVPLGTFCSGGIDSGVVTGYAVRHSSDRLMTFSVGFEDPEWDETALASDTATRFGTAHHVLAASPGDFESSLATLIDYNDEPLSHPNSVPLFLLSRFAREHVKVVLTGEGADELFCGYPRYQVARVRGALRVVPQRAVDLLAAVAGLAPGHRATLLADLLRLPFEDSLILNSLYVEPQLAARLTGTPVESALSERRSVLAEAMLPGDPLASISRYELLTYLDCALERMDRMSMATGLEARVPFLNLPLVNWALCLPSAHKMKGFARKRVLRRLADRMLSQKVARGPKSGFGIPIDCWFRTNTWRSLVDRLRDPTHPASAHFDRALLNQLVTEHSSGVRNHGEVLWLIANVFLWQEIQASRCSWDQSRRP